MNYQPEKNQEFINDFNTSNTIGKKGEDLFINFVQSKWPNLKVEDVSGKPEFQWSEIDYVIHYPDGTTRTVELKTDVYSTTGNFAMEVVANKEIGRKGWLHTSKADSLAYLFINGFKDGSDNLFIMKFEDVRRVVAQNPRLMERVVTPERQLRGSGMKTTIVKLLPRTMMKDYAKTYKIAAQNVKNSHSAQAGWNR